MEKFSMGIFSGFVMIQRFGCIWCFFFSKCEIISHNMAFSNPMTKISYEITKGKVLVLLNPRTLRFKSAEPGLFLSRCLKFAQWPTRLNLWKMCSHDGYGVWFQSMTDLSVALHWKKPNSRKLPICSYLLPAVQGSTGVAISGGF